MKLLCITDLHGGRSALSRILARELPTDVILLGGDLTNFGTPDEAERMVLDCHPAAQLVLAVAGNCDSPAIDKRLKELDVTLFERGVTWHGVGFYGVSAMPPWRGDMYELTETEIDAALRAGKQMLPQVEHEVVLSHPPPRGTTVDQTGRGTHVGSVAVRNFVDQVQPSLVVCGHIHEARGVDQVGRTTVVNCGFGLKGLYAVVDLGSKLLVDLRHI